MQTKKNVNLLDKIVKKNYKNELEKVLEEKFFEESAKSLLLEILYKIETSYKDYSIVKKDIKTKDEYIKDFIKNIKYNCKTIQIIKPSSEKRKLLRGKSFIIKKEKKEIICLPITRKLLYAINKINKKELIIKDEYFFINKTLSNLINTGSIIDAVEPLRDFNGWSWTVLSKEIESIESNLVYQCINILVGNKFLNLWVKNKEVLIDYLEEFKNKLEEKYGPELAKKIIYSLYKLSVLIEIKLNKKVKENLYKEKEQIKNELLKFENKASFIEELSIQKNNLKKQIKQIDTILNNKDLLHQEYIKRTKENFFEDKIFSMKVLVKIIIKEREELLNELEQINNLLKPKNFVNRKKELEKNMEYLNLVMVKDEEKELEKEIIKFQKNFLECFKIKIKKAESKLDIINLIYEYRYYCLLPYNKSLNVFNLEILQKYIQAVGKSLIKKAITQKVIIPFAKGESLNYKIIENIFTLRALSLEEVSVKITKDKENYYIYFFDDNIFEEKIQLDINEPLNKKDLKIKLNKKVKMFE